MSQPTITHASISAMPKHILDNMPVVSAKFSNGQTHELFSFYPDEIMFEAKEFIGLSREQAMALKQKKDLNYLQTPHASPSVAPSRGLKR